MTRAIAFFIVGVISICLFFSGCFYVVSGAVGLLGGYAISNDTIQGEVDKPFDNLWKSSVNVLDILGNITLEDKPRGLIEAKVNGADVKVMIEQLTPKASRFRVAARKYLLPKINVAQKIYIKVIQRAK